MDIQRSISNENSNSGDLIGESFIPLVCFGFFFFFNYDRIVAGLKSVKVKTLRVLKANEELKW